MSPHRTAGLASRVWDAVVVGAGPAGSMTARQLALTGASVLMVDRKAFPRWKVCGACLSPGAQAVLRDTGLGHVPVTLGAVPLRRLRLAGWSLEAEIPLRGSVALSRGAFDAALVEAASMAGVTFVAPARARPGSVDADARAVRLDVDGVSVTVCARVVVAADGLGSGFLAAALAGGTRPDGGGAPDGARSSMPPGAVTPTAESRIGVGATFGRDTPGYEPGVIHMGVGDAGYVGIVRLEDGTLDVACALTQDRLARGGRPGDVVKEILHQAGMPPLPGRPITGWKGTPALTRTPEARGGHRLFAVGDAAGYVEPFTGEGMAWALGGARALAPIAAKAIDGWDPGLLEAWEAAHRRTVGGAAVLCRGVAWGLRRPALSRAALRVLGLAPFVASPFVRRAARAPSGLGAPSGVRGLAS